MTVQTDIQSFDSGELVTLFELDTSIYDGSVHRFCSSVDNGASVVWAGNTYPPFPVEAEGFERNGKGQLPQPILRIADPSGAIYSLIRNYKDLIGATVTVIRTFRKYLDGEETADTSAKFPDEVYQIERKSAQNRFMTEFTLSALVDMQGLKLPKRIVLKNICSHIYRVWNGASFTYTDATCPYTGTGYFTALGVSTTSDLDVCGKRFSDCQLRYPQPETLPTRAFPGVENVRN